MRFPDHWFRSYETDGCIAVPEATLAAMAVEDATNEGGGMPTAGPLPYGPPYLGILAPNALQLAVCEPEPTPLSPPSRPGLRRILATLGVTIN